MKFKKGDEVIITAGKDLGKKAKIEKVLSKENGIFLPGLNVFKKHMKKRDEKNPGGIIEFSKPVAVSNIALICPKCGRVTRIGYKVKGKEKFRICRKCKAVI
ncbi:50S ribosomal protein L24 [Candidatus Gottesmanbacteria bacterium RBG_13_37_7]|uniref:Large ribosomal subunit protein uL24 n=1 Tax=Candidatus Gottesmanbacteria bacterium RBG_13_37_7 TaxID=1798369 RepID=A0A1F5YJH7_9BACT|nr:MAG: 50S ribosomal protein L24 [Candidatus Gottesmanbacteria bacterium RBG_13_37_7]